MQQATVQPLRVKYHDDELGVDAVRVVGYRGYCPCGWQSARHRTHNGARVETQQHKRADHGHRS